MRILNTFRPTTIQKQVIAKIAAAATPTVAGDSVSSGANTVSARDTLVKLGIITFEAGEATLTDLGTQIATAENIVDETGGLTQVGQSLAGAKETQQVPTTTEPAGPLESFATLKALLR